MRDEPTVGERIARTIAAAWWLYYGIDYVGPFLPFGVFIGSGVIGFIGLFAMGLAAAGAGLVALATRRRPYERRRARLLIACAGAAAGTVVFVSWVALFV